MDDEMTEAQTSLRRMRKLLRLIYFIFGINLALFFFAGGSPLLLSFVFILTLFSVRSYYKSYDEFVFEYGRENLPH